MSVTRTDTLLLNGGGSVASSDAGFFARGGNFRGAIRRTFVNFTRKKPLSSAMQTDSLLTKSLTTLDLTALGIGSTLGVGVYVLAGSVSKNEAGPSVIISFLIAAIASIFAGLCYAEFGARVPKAGSAYIYSYVCVGEFIAFIIGWNLILEYVIGTASVVRALSSYVDGMINNTMSNTLKASMPMAPPQHDYISEYPDFFAFTVTMVFSIALAFGAKESSRFNNLFTGINLSVVLFVIIIAAFHAKAHNWTIPEDDVKKWVNATFVESKRRDFGKGGFAPYGIAGIMKGAATCFYGFIGFDCIATASEEAKDPQKSIPIAVVVSLFMVFLAYFGISTVLTLALPYYLQDENTPLPYLFGILNLNWAKYVVSLGAMCGLCSSLLGAMFPLPRIIYAMASDGLVFRSMGNINSRFQTPLVGTLVAGLFTGTMAVVFSLKQLINMMSIGTLLAYTMVASCVLMLRYKITTSNKKIENRRAVTFQRIYSQLFNSESHAYPTELSSSLVTWAVISYVLLCAVFTNCVSAYASQLVNLEILPILYTTITGSLTFMALYVISRQPVSENKPAFVVPLVPWLPGASIVINVYLMLNLDTATWIRFAIWIVIGLLIYLTYGIKNSVERLRAKSETSSLNGLDETSPLNNLDEAAYHRANLPIETNS